MFKYKKQSFKGRRAQSTLELISLIVFIVVTFLVFQKYVARALMGRWQGVGDSIGAQRLYDPDKTIDCAFDQVYTNDWYDHDCFKDEGCPDKCYGPAGETNPAQCEECIKVCQRKAGGDKCVNME